MKRKRERTKAILMLLAIEMGMASLAGGVIAAVLVPVAYQARGHFTMGGEWLLIYLITMLAFHIIHEQIFRQSRKRQKGGNDARRKTTRRTVRRCGNPVVDVGRSA